MKYSKILLCFGALWASSAFPAPAPCDTLRVAFLTDIHVTPGNVQDSLFRIAVDEINASPCDIVIFGGDLTNLGSDAELKYVHGLISRLENRGTPCRATTRPRGPKAPARLSPGSSATTGAPPSVPGTTSFWATLRDLL